MEYQVVRVSNKGAGVLKTLESEVKVMSPEPIFSRDVAVSMAERMAINERE